MLYRNHRKAHTIHKTDVFTFFLHKNTPGTFACIIIRMNNRNAACTDLFTKRKGKVFIKTHCHYGKYFSNDHAGGE